MNDLALTWNQKLGGADYSILGNDLAQTAALESAVMLSLFLRRRAGPSDTVPPEFGADRGGWWADELAPIQGDKIGSRLWLLQRVKEVPEVLSRGREYVLEALDWMVVDRVAEKVAVTAEIPQRGVLLLVPQIFRPKRDPISFRYDYNWQAQALRRA